MALTDNLVSYWKLDESSGDAADAHGSNTLTNQNSAAYATGKLNNGLDLEAASSQSLTITDAAQSGLDLSTALSFSLWYKQESAPGTQYQFINKLLGGGEESYFFAYRTASTPNLRLLLDATGAGTSTDLLGINWTPTDGQWYHLVITWLGSTKTAKIYIDGTQTGGDLVGSVVSSIYNGAANFGIGTALVEGFDGMIDEVGVWSRVLTSDEVTSLYNGGTPLAYPLVLPGGFKPHFNIIM